MRILLISFLSLAILLWLTTLGYLAVLFLLSRTRRRSHLTVEDWPEIAVVIPTYNEEDHLPHKLADLERSNYPDNLLHILVIDGGSKDRTTALAQQKTGRGEPIRVVRLAGAKNKIEQVIHCLMLLQYPFIVFTDADTRLDSACIKELIRLLLSDPKTAIVGAIVKPESCLLEEKIHWALLNSLWWLEGEALSSAGFSGVCYAIRSGTVRWLDKDIKAEDIHLSLTACAGGHRVRLARSAVAHELRVPQKFEDFLRFRRRRGSRYVMALRHFAYPSPMPFSWRIVRWFRLWQFGVVPWLATACIGLGLIVSATSHWRYPAILSSLFIVPALSAVPVLNRKISKKIGWSRLIVASARYLALLLISLVTLNRGRFSEIPRGVHP
jgi:cellulose synthase/poly-beta-1,6-N-acetylglucosamine synthase-like glycosyltransferase